MVRLSEKTALGSPYTTNRLVFVMHELIVFCEAVPAFFTEQKADKCLVPQGQGKFRIY
jgi:hypothetical protein